MYTKLETLRDALADIAGVKTCLIGVEDGMSPACYPMIRIVPRRFVPGAPYHQRTAEIDIYFGCNTTESEGLELVYCKLLEMEAEIIKAVKEQEGKYIETITDEDRLDTYKLMVVRCEVETARPTVT